MYSLVKNFQIFAFVVAFTVTEIVLGLFCHSCTNVTSSGLCNTSIFCTQGQRCYAKTLNSGNGVLISMGCKSDNECGMLKSSGAPVAVGKRVPRSGTDCSQCCDTELCNLNVCNSTATNCEDDPTFDCARVNTLLNLCSNTDKAKSVCRKFCGLCPVDGNWSNWSTWSRCSSTCGIANSTRIRTCTNPTPANGGQNCTGINSESKDCGYKVPCPVPGGWNTWSSWGFCSVSCGIGLQRRDRQYSKPYPSYGGEHCFGDSRDDRPCFNRACQDGGWSDWTGWDSCSQTCGPGMKRRHRQCNNPIPSPFGKDCQGDSTDYKVCTVNVCDDGGWSEWESWGRCSQSCGRGIKTRHRQCDNPTPSKFSKGCDGDSTDSALCTVNMCDGKWSSWGNWYCKHLHGRSVGDRFRRYLPVCVRTRSCSISGDNPAHCIGSSEDQSVLDICDCR